VLTCFFLSFDCFQKGKGNPKQDPESWGPGDGEVVKLLRAFRLVRTARLWLGCGRLSQFTFMVIFK
jgi:hypothetical protein